MPRSLRGAAARPIGRTPKGKQVKLRPYQEVWVRRIFARKERRILCVGPTGCGKTVVALSVIRRHVRRGERVLFLAHRRELVRQAERMFGGKQSVSVIMAGHEEQPSQAIHVGSVQTLVRRNPEERADYDVIIIDEAHHAVSSTYRRIVAANPGAKIYGLTATPRRADGQALGDMFDVIVECPLNVEELIDVGRLMRPRTFTPEGDRDSLYALKVNGGDFDREGLGEFATRTRLLVGDVIKHWTEHAKGRPTVVYAVNVLHAEILAKRFQKVVKGKGKVRIVTGETPREERDEAIQGLEDGRVTVLVNVEVLTEGWDSKTAQVCVMARPTLSETLYLQMVGRIMRVNEEEAQPILLDHAGNALIHGYPEDVRQWSLDGEKVTIRLRAMPQPKICPRCKSSNKPGTRVCRNCGLEFWGEKDLPPEDEMRALKEMDWRWVREEAIRMKRENPKMSCKAIAEAVGVQDTTVLKWCKAAGLNTRNPNYSAEGTKQRVIQMKKENPSMSCREIAKAIGADRISVSNWLKAAGLNTSNPRCAPEETKQRAIQMRRENPSMSCKAITKASGVSFSTVHSWLKAAGLDTRAS